MISVNKLDMFYGQKILFKDVSFQLNPKNRYGIVGANGSGKSTLMKLIEGKIVPEKGDINKPSKLTLGTLSQDHFKFENERIIDTVIIGKKILWDAIKEKDEILKINDHTAEAGHRLLELETIIADNNGYFAESIAGEMLEGLGIPVKQHLLPLSSLSGGYKLRVLLAQCLFSEPDCLLLDEPTNHLDIIAIAWLEQFLLDFAGIILVVSHDQYFLNNICTHIMDIDYETIKIYKGNYDKFVQAKDLERIQKENEFTRQEKKKEELQSFVDRFKAKATKARQAQSRVKMIEKMDDIELKNSSRIAPVFKFDILNPTARKILEMDGISKTFGDKKVLSDLTLKLERGEKLAIVGANGVGKSTLLKILMDLIPASKGTFEWGQKIKLGYFPQDHHEILKDKTTPYEWLHNQAPGETIGAIRGLLGRMLIKNDDVHKPVTALSGGEAARLIFAKLIIEKPNILLLDEPTNHMDMETIESLSEALMQYQGSLILVSHYRQLVHKVATSILAIKEDSYEYFQGTYHEYLEKQGVDFLNRSGKGDNKKDKVETLKQPKIAKDNNKYKKDGVKIEKKLANCEGKINLIEAELVEIEAQLADNNIYLPKNAGKLKIAVESQKIKKEELSKELALWETLSQEFESVK